MRIIVLNGHRNCGKSKKLNCLRDLLLIAGKAISANAPHIGDESEAFHYKDKIICVALGGETGDIMKLNMAYFKSTIKADIR